MFKNILVFILFSISTCFATNSGSLQYAYWNPLGNQLFDESMILPSLNSAESSVVIILLDQTEPVSFVLQNSGKNNVEVQRISVIKSSELDNLDYDFRVVKNWYMGSQTSMSVTTQGLRDPKLTPELLLKNDSLIITDAKIQKNYVQTRESAGVVSYQDISSPRVLMPNDAVINDTPDLQPFVINHQRGKQIWLNIKTNLLTVPKQYNLQIKIDYVNDNRKQVLIIPLIFEVLPIVLGNDKLNHSIYYSGQLRNVNRLLTTPKNEAQYIAELKDLKAHGVLYPTQYISSDDESTIGQYIKIRSQLGFPCDKIYFLGGAGDAHVQSLSKLESNIQILKRLAIKNSNCSNSQIYLYGIDEAGGAQLVAESLDWQSVVSNGGNVFVASNKGDLLKNNMLVNLNTLVFGNVRDTSDKNAMRKLGKDVYLYGRPQTGIPNPFIYRKNYGYYLIKNDYTGAMPFAYQFGFPEKAPSIELIKGICFSKLASGYCSAWNNFDSLQFYDHMFTYPTTDGVIDTVQWEGYAAAITDTRYYYTLLDLMKAKCKKNDTRCNFDPMSLIDVDDPAATRQRIIDKIKLLFSVN